MARTAFFDAKALATESSTNVVRVMWDRLSGMPGGKWLFSKLVGRMAPYTGTMHAQVDELRDRYSRVTMPDKPGLRNHLASAHAIALANLVELTGNLALAYSLPDDARFIVAGLSMNYVKKGHGPITGECHSPFIATSDRREYEVAVTLKDEANDVVAEGTLRTLVGPKQPN